MNGRCASDPLDQAIDVCDVCYEEFCQSCLVTIRGRKHPLCRECALSVAGIKGRTRRKRRGSRRTAKRRRQQLADAARDRNPSFAFFNDPPATDTDNDEGPDSLGRGDQSLDKAEHLSDEPDHPYTPKVVGEDSAIAQLEEKRRSGWLASPQPTDTSDQKGSVRHKFRTEARDDEVATQRRGERRRPDSEVADERLQHSSEPLTAPMFGPIRHLGDRRAPEPSADEVDTVHEAGLSAPLSVAIHTSQPTQAGGQTTPVAVQSATTSATIEDPNVTDGGSASNPIISPDPEVETLQGSRDVYDSKGRWVPPPLRGPDRP